MWPEPVVNQGGHENRWPAAHRYDPVAVMSILSRHRLMAKEKKEVVLTWKSSLTPLAPVG